MSVTIDDKIEMFRKVLFGDLETESSEKKKKLIEKFEKEKDKFRQDIEKRKKSIVEEAIKKAEREKQQMHSRANAEDYRKRLEKKQEFVNSAVLLLRDRATQYVKTVEYREQYLSKSINDACRALGEAQHITFYITKYDMENNKAYIEEIILKNRNEKEFDIKNIDSDIIGGFIVEDKENENELQLDYTLKVLIEDCREEIGINISQRLDEVMC